MRPGVREIPAYHLKVGASLNGSSEQWTFVPLRFQMLFICRRMRACYTATETTVPTRCQSVCLCFSIVEHVFYLFRSSITT